VEGLRSRLAQFDAVDQAEILIAEQMICGALGLPSNGHNRELTDAFEKLPPRVGTDLARFAAMATSSCGSIVALLSTTVQFA